MTDYIIALKLLPCYQVSPFGIITKHLDYAGVIVFILTGFTVKLFFYCIYKQPKM